MSQTVALCLDEDSQQHPEYLGLEGESFGSQPWLQVFENGADARISLHKANGVDEVWVASCGDIEPINLAASLKRDRPDLVVKLVAVTAGGSLRSRASTASIDEVLEVAAFVRLYGEMKQKCNKLLAPPNPNQRIELPDPRINSTLNSANSANSASTLNGPASMQLPPVIPQEVRLPESEQEEMPTRTESPLCVAAPKRKGFLMSIVSGSGGCGKSTISVLTAFDAAQKGYRTLLLDCDLQFGDTAYLLRNIPSTPIDELVENPLERKRVCEQEAPLVVIGAPKHFEASEVIGGQVEELIDELVQHFDAMIVNTGSNWSEQHAVLLEKSSVVLFLIDQRSSSVRACRHALELCNRCGIATIPFKFALNRCAKNAPIALGDIARIFPDSQIFELRDGGIEVEEYCASGNAFELRERGNVLATSVGNMMTQLLPASDSAACSQSALSEVTPCKRRRGYRASKRHSRAAL